ncbi:MAG: 50S ribosomal protein L32 [Syntrophobacteraceae bacterium]|jgi:large subunit ribosomal protein L32|nr:50S ribosomal protein L32 [Syntrophobacteraceae bacterium]
MGVPKKKTSKSRRDKRSAHHGLSTPSTSRCPQCNELRLPHRVCPGCGYYRDRVVLNFEEE